jgi:hypothetical protein
LYLGISRGGEFWVIVALPFLGGARLAGKALDDLIVVEFAQMVSGPMCGKMFADQSPPATTHSLDKKSPFKSNHLRGGRKGADPLTPVAHTENLRSAYFRKG